MAEKSYNLTPFIPWILSTFIAIIYLFITNLTDEYTVLSGVVFGLILALIYLKINKYLINSGVLFFLLYLTFWIIPTVDFYLYSSNNNYYTATDLFHENQKKFINELIINSEIESKELDNIIITLNKISSEEFSKKKKYDGEGNFIREITQIINFNNLDTIWTPEIIKINLERGFDNKFHMVLETEDSRTTSLKIKSDFPFPSDGEIIETIEYQRDKLKEFEEIQSGQDKIYYNEFLIEAITCFSSGDISPSRNLSKLLNGLEGLLLLMLTTIIINTTGAALTVKLKAKSTKSS